MSSDDRIIRRFPSPCDPQVFNVAGMDLRERRVLAIRKITAVVTPVALLRLRVETTKTAKNTKREGSGSPLCVLGGLCGSHKPLMQAQLADLDSAEADFVTVVLKEDGCLKL